MSTFNGAEFSSYFEINIAKDFSSFLKGKMRKDGPYSAEVFREDFLVPALKKFDQVTVDLNGVKGYPDGFLREVFGKLDKHFNYDTLMSKLSIESDNNKWSTEAWRAIDDKFEEFE